MSALRIPAVLAAALCAAPVFAQTTGETQMLLKELKLQPSVLKGMEQELAVPPAWIAGAKKEGKVRVTMTTEERDFEKIRKIFNARYPGVEIEYSRGIGARRALTPLLAFRRGSSITDIVSSFQVLEQEYRSADALLKIDEMLPAARSIAREYKSPHGIGVAFRVTNYCMAYAKDRVKREELPKTWDELVTHPRWRNGKVGMAANANAWLAQLWVQKGDAWGRDYVNRIFTQLRPQLRKENLSTIGRLAALGEYDIAIPSSDGATHRNASQGIAVAYHCPDVVPVAVLWVGIMKNSPNVNASLIFTNWLLSKEGQLAIHWADSQTPANSGLNVRELLFYPDEVLGKTRAPETSAVVEQMPKIMELWQSYWVKAGGAPIGGDDGDKKGAKKGAPR